MRFRNRSLPLAVAAAASLLVVACSGGGGSGVTPSGAKTTMTTPKSVSPALVKPAPMAKTTKLPSSAMSGRTPASTISNPNFTQLPGTATDVAVASDGTVYALSDQPSGADKYIWKYSGGTWTNIPGEASRLAVAPNGTLYAINSGGGIYKYVITDSGFVALGGGASYITTIADNTIVVISNDGSGGIWHLESDGTTWEQLPGEGVGLSGNKTANAYTINGGTVSPGGVYIVNASQEIYYENLDDSFVRIPGSAVAVESSSGGLFALSPGAVQGGFPLYYLDVDAGTWSSIDGAGTTVSANDGLLTVTNSDGAIYQTDASTPTPSPTSTPTVTPTSTPTVTPTSTPTSAPANAVSNGDFETGSLGPWYTCYVAKEKTTPETDPNPVDSPSAYTSPSPGPAATVAPTTAPNSTDVTIQTDVEMTGGAPQAVHGGSHAALVGMALGLTSANRGKGTLGICQNVTVPATAPSLTLWVLEGGNNAYFDGQDEEGAIFLASAGLSSTNPNVAALPDKVLFAENNCWNGLNAGTGNSAQAPCAIDHSGSPDLANGNVWREKGPYDLTAYAGQDVTLFLGIYNSSTSTTYYNYAYFDDVSLMSAPG